ncbi:substrate-binding periplasmic protein [Pseudaestuariivita sp.]|uniref:substrate-binding periplasmic protein n=1 Tax=Pseudaestuariivita sp. TaxID=2211669 RepID=UPI0040585CE4
MTTRTFRFSALVVAAIIAANTATARPLEEILNSGVLRACVPTANPPDGEVIPEGCTGYCQYEGIIGDLVETFADSIDVTPEYYVQSWDSLFHNADGETVKDASYTPRAMEAEQCDMIGAVMVPLEWRLKKMDMECFLPSRMMVVTHRDRVGDFSGPEDLAGLSVAVERSMYLHDWVEDQNAGIWSDNPATIHFRDYKDTIPAVDQKDVDFTVVSVLDALYQTRHVSKNSVAAFAVGDTNTGCWGYRKGDTEMGDLIKSFFEGQTAEPNSDLNAVWQAYYGMRFSEFVRLVSSIQ